MLTCTRLYRVHCKHITSVKPLYRLYSTKPKEDFSILTELVYGRKRVYTSLQTIAKTKPATVSRGVIASPVTSSPLSWEWIQSSEGKKDAKDTKSWYEVRKKSNGLNFINSVKQNMREMYLPVG